MARAVLGVAGAVVGGIMGGPSGAIKGFQIGYAVGSVLDATIFAPSVEGPRLNDVQMMTSSEGTAIGRVFGTVRVSTQLIWAANFKETAKTQSSGGKGGPKSTTYQYSGSFAVAICEGSSKTTLGQVWADGKLLDLSKYTYRFYKGTETQTADSLIQSIEGTNYVSAYRGIAYIVFEDMPLDQFGNRYPQITAEVTKPIETDNTTESLIAGVSLIPSTGSFAYADEPYIRSVNEIESVAENVHTSSGRADILESLDQLDSALPNCDTVSLVVSWFGDDLRCGVCEIKPKIGIHPSEQAVATWLPNDWSVAGLSAQDVETTSVVSGSNAFGSTPDDESVKSAIAELNSRGKRVVFYPFVLMDIPPGNTLPNPYSDNAATNGQPEFPWRGRITCSPAAGYTGTVDKTATAATQVDTFFDSTWGYENFILHYANLCADAGGVDVFLIGSELRGMTQIRSDASTYPTVTRLKALASAVKAILPSALVSYAADWSEYHSHRPSDGTGDVYFHLDPLWSDSNIDFIGIDNYLPITDHRLTSTQNIYDLGYLKAGIESGEYYDWYYASDSDRTAGTRTAITDGAYDKPWVFRDKDIRNWWRNDHYNRPAGTESVTATDWVPGDKSIWFTEFGCPAINRGTNQPNVFTDALSSESAIPHFSTGNRDDLIQERYLRAMIEYWRDNGDILAGGGGSVSYTELLTNLGKSAGQTAVMDSLTMTKSGYEFEKSRFPNGYYARIYTEGYEGGSFDIYMQRTVSGYLVENDEVAAQSTIIVGDFIDIEFEDDPGQSYQLIVRTLKARYWFNQYGSNVMVTVLGCDVVGKSGTGSVFANKIVDPANMIVWAWDARPYPAFPQLTSVWADGANYATGHWINGRMGSTNSLGDLIREICSRTMDTSLIDTSLVIGSGLTVDGYYISQISSPRDDLAPLLSLHSIDVHESGGSIKFIHRSVSQTLEIDQDDLVPQSGNDVGYKISRAMSYEIPSNYALTYMDRNNGYQSASVSGIIEGSNTPGIVAASYPIVMNEAQAKALADTLINGAVTAREQIQFGLPPSYSALEPGDIITMSGRELGFLVNRSSLGDSLRFDGVGAQQSIYEAAIGSDGGSYSGGTAGIFGPVLGVFLDIPMFSADEASPHSVRFAAAAVPWPGGAALYRENGSGGFDLQLVAPARAVIGELTEALDASAAFDWDDVTELKIRLYSDDNLVSLDDADVLAGGNTLAVESPSGLWEIIAFADATLTGTRAFTLTRLRRGQYGTDIEMREAPYPVGSKVVLLDENVINVVPMTVAQKDTNFTYRYGPYVYAQDHMTFTEVDHQGAAVGLRPYSPINLTANDNVDGDIELFWTRRTRFVADDFTGVLPLNEETETYEVEIMSLDGTTVVRTVIGLGAPSWRYTATNQTTDFGAPIDVANIIYRVYQISATYGRGPAGLYP